MRLILRLTGMGVLLLLASPVFALTCMRPDVAFTFNHLDEAEEIYVVVHGNLSFDENMLPVTDWDRQLETPPSTPISARLKGQSLRSEGFVTLFDREVTFNVQCFGPWCASAKSGSEVLAFVEYRAGEYVFSLGPCYINGFFEPTEEMLDQVQTCMREESCGPQEF